MTEERTRDMPGGSGVALCALRLARTAVLLAAIGLVAGVLATEAGAKERGADMEGQTAQLPSVCG